MKKFFFVTGSPGFMGFSLAKSLLDKVCQIYRYDCMSDYYDVTLKHARHKILQNFEIFSFTEKVLENQ